MADETEPGRHEHDERIRAARRFGRDVFVNVVANLIAGLILYLLGVLAGLFHRLMRRSCGP
jgi:hypothetical protein